MNFNKFILAMNFNKFIRGLDRFDCFASSCTLLSLVLYLQPGGIFKTLDGSFYGFHIHHGIWGQGAFPVVQRVQSKNLLNARPRLEPLRTSGHMSLIAYNLEGVYRQSFCMLPRNFLAPHGKDVAGSFLH